MKWSLLIIPFIIYSCVLLKKDEHILQEINFKGQVICKASSYFETPIESSILIIKDTLLVSEFKTDIHGYFNKSLMIDTNLNPFKMIVKGLSNIKIDTIIARHLTEEEKEKGRKRIKKYNKLYEKGLIDFKMNEKMDTVIPTGVIGYNVHCTEKYIKPTNLDVFIFPDSLYKINIKCDVDELEESLIIE